VFIYVKKAKIKLCLRIKMRIRIQIKGLKKMRIRIQGLQKCGSNADPDPKPWVAKNKVRVCGGREGAYLVNQTSEVGQKRIVNLR